MPHIKDFLGNAPVKALFIPYAAVTFSYDEYEAKVKARFNEIGHEIVSVHRFSDPVAAVAEAGSIVVGGGNTFHLLKEVRRNGLLEPIRQRVQNGLPYIGWSAGSNLACPTIMTTNDMPICDPKGFDAFNLIPFQINPHYLDAHPSGHAGETREQRIMEFIEANPHTYVLGLREGCMFQIENGEMKLIGPSSVRVFKKNEPVIEVSSAEELNQYLKK
jgi:dipeptidase E